MNHREDKHLESFQDNISFHQKELLMKNEIIKSLTETQTVVLNTILTSQRMCTANKNSSDASENPSNTTLAAHNHQQQHQQQQQKQQQQQQQQQQNNQESKQSCDQLYNKNR